MKGFFFDRGQHGCEDRMRGHRDGFGRGPHRHGAFGHNPFGGGNPFERMGRDFGGRMGGRGRDGGGRGGFGHGGLRLVILKLLGEQPSHGYELIKAIEDRSNGAYSPSPGVIYPTLSWLEDEGFITVEAGEDGRKMAHITDAGRAFLTQKAEAVDALFAAMDEGRSETGHGDYAQLFRAMHNLGGALKARGMKPMAQADIEAIVDMIDELAKKIERS